MFMEKNTLLIHSLNKIVDLILTVSSVSSLLEVNSLLRETSTRGGELEGPQEFVHIFEVGTNSEDFMDDIFNANDAKLFQILLYEFVIGESDPLASNFNEAPLVDELPNSLKIRVSPSDVGIHELQHLKDGTIDANEDTVMNLSQTEQTQYLPRTRINPIDTTNSDNKGELRFRFTEKVSSRSSLPT